MADRPSSQTKAPRTPALTPVGPHEGKPPVLLSRPVTLVGSRQNARLHLISRSVSKAHALVVVSNDRVYIRDLASRAGVIINGASVREVDLQDGDHIQIGSFQFRFTPGAYMKSSWKEGARPEPAVLEVAGEELALPIQEHVVLIGRRSSCDLPLAEENVSTAHAVVFEMEGQRYVRDLGSRSGTFVNGQKVSQAELKFGDQLRIGDTHITYAAAPEDYVEEAPAEPATVPVGELLDGLSEEDLAAMEDLPSVEAPAEPPAEEALDELPPLEPIEVPEPQPVASPPQPEAAATAGSPSWIEEEIDALEKQPGDSHFDPESIEEALGLIQKEEVPQDVDLDEDPDVAYDAHATAKLNADPDKTALHPVISDQVVDLPDNTENDELKQQLSVSEDLLPENSSDEPSGTDVVEVPAGAAPPVETAHEPELLDDQSMFRIPEPSEETSDGGTAVAEEAAPEPAEAEEAEPVAESEEAQIDQARLSLQSEEPADAEEDLAPADLADLESQDQPAPVLNFGDRSQDKTYAEESAEAPLIRADAFDGTLELSTASEAEAEGNEEAVSDAEVSAAEAELELPEAASEAHEEPIPVAEESDELDPLMLAGAEPEPVEVVEPTEPTLESALDLEVEAAEPESLEADAELSPLADEVSDSAFAQSVEEFAGQELGPIVEPEPVELAPAEASLPPVEIEADPSESELELEGLVGENAGAAAEAEQPEPELPELELPVPRAEAPVEVDEAPPLPLPEPRKKSRRSRKAVPSWMVDLGADRESFLGGAPLDLGSVPPPPPPADFASLDSPAVPAEIPPVEIPELEPPPSAEVPPLDLDSELHSPLAEDPPPLDRNISTDPPELKFSPEPTPLPAPPRRAGPFASSPFEQSPDELEPFDEAPSPSRKKGSITGFDGLAVPVQEADVFSQLFPAISDEELLASKSRPDDALPASAPPPGAPPRGPGARTPVPRPDPRPSARRAGRDERRFNTGPMLLLMLLVAIAAAAVPYLLVSRKYTVEARLQFRNFAALSPAEQRELFDRQRDLMSDGTFRVNVLQILQDRHNGQVKAGFLGDAGEYASAVTSAAWQPREQDGYLRLTFKGTDPNDDPLRMRALLSQLFTENRDQIDAINRLREQVQSTTRQIEQHKARKQELDEQIRAADAAYHQRPAPAQVESLEADLVKLDEARKTASASVARLQAELDVLLAAQQPAATQPAAEDAELAQLRQSLAGVERRIADAESGADPLELARRRLDEEMQQFQRQVADAGQAIEQDPRLDAYVKAAQQLQTELRQTMGELLLRQQEQHARLAELRRQLQEKLDLRRKTVWKDDEQLQKYEQQLAMETRQYNAALASGMENEAADLKAKMDLHKSMIEARQAVLGDDSVFADTIAQLEELVADMERQVQTDRRVTEQSVLRLQETFRQSHPTTRELPAEQKALAAALAERIEQIHQARQAYTAALNVKAGEAAADAGQLKDQARLIRERIAQREGQLAELAALPLAEAEAQLEQKRQALAAAQQEESAAHEAYFAAEKELRGLRELDQAARGAGLQADERKLEKMKLAGELERQEAQLATAQAQLKRAVEPVEPGESSVTLTPLPDNRPLTAGGAAAAVVLVFAGLIYFNTGRAGHSAVPYPIPAHRLEPEPDTDHAAGDTPIEPAASDDQEPVTAQEA